MAVRNKVAHCPSLRCIGSLQCKDTLVPCLIESDTRKNWTSVENVNDCAWIIPLLFAFTVIQYFGVKGYGEVSDHTLTINVHCLTLQVEFLLSAMKITACIGFMILGIIIDCGGVPTDDRGYIGARYWYGYGRRSS